MNFLDIPVKKPPYNLAKAVILPIPFAGTTSGTARVMDKGPEAILQASQLLSIYDVETNTDVNELGLLTLDPLACPEGPREAVEEIFAQATPHFKKHKLVAGIGGSHLISLGLVRAALEQYNDLSVLHLGAHPHLIIEDGAVYNEAGVMARIHEKCAVSHIGIRSMTKAERSKVHLDNLVFARDIYNNGLNAAADAIDLLGDKVYIALHLDVLDPACMPCVVRPEPGGLDWYTLNALIRMVSREKSVVGFDITGLVPQKNGEHAQLLAAKLVYKTLICIMQNSL
jgi:agmatinase